MHVCDKEKTLYGQKNKRGEPNKGTTPNPNLIRSFEDYIKEDMNPLGLQVQIFPTLEGLAFKLQWEFFLRTCLNDMMQLLITEYGKRSEALDKDIIVIVCSYRLTKPINHFREGK